MNRTYDSRRRDEAKRVTRDRILDALVDVVTREGVHAFSVQKVADAAGVAHRTVYRHFPTREELLDGLDELIERRGREAALDPEPAELTDVPGLVAAGYRSFDAYPEGIRAYVIVSIALGRRVPSFERRTRAMREYISRTYPGLTADEVAEAAGVIRLLGSSRGWHLLTTEQDLSTDAAARAASRAVEVLLADLAARSADRTP